jgi:hypothetical protein
MKSAPRKHEFNYEPIVGYSSIIRECPSSPLLSRNTQRNLFREGFDWDGALTQAIRLRVMKDGNEPRCPKNVGDGPVFTRSIHEDLYSLKIASSEEFVGKWRA